VLGVAGVEEERGWNGGSTANRGGRGAPRDNESVPVARVPEGLQLRKCIKIPTEIIDSQSSEIQLDLSYTEHPIKILDTKERSTRRKTIRMFKIQWDRHTEEEATWETESYLQRNFPDFLQANSESDHPIPSCSGISGRDSF
jgi:hypothetical protein